MFKSNISIYLRESQFINLYLQRYTYLFSSSVNINNETCKQVTSKITLGDNSISVLFQSNSTFFPIASHKHDL